jgi:ABC-type branched-subunit amino acid transport system ATPase component/branched-subunit amino acid ABC-type transport system permease component
MNPRRRPLVFAASLVIALWLLSEVFPHAWPKGQILQGVIFGASAGLLALGLVLVYRTTRVINFSYGAMGSFAAEVGVFAYHKFGLPWPVCVALAVAVGVGAGVAVERVMRRLVGAPRLVVTVATIGLLQLFTGLQFMVPFFGHGRPVETSFPTGLSKLHLTVGHSLFHGNDLLAVAIVPVVLIGLSWFLLGTEAGTAVRAIAENTDRAMLLGIPIHRLSRLVWMIVGAVAAAVIVLNAPTNGVPLNFVGASGVFMPALAAAVVAKMESLPIAFGTGVGLGILNSIVSQNAHKEALGTVVFLVVILVALLARRWGSTRAETAGESSWSLSGTGRQLPKAVAKLPEVVYGRMVILALLGLLAVAFPLLAPLSRIHTITGYLLLGMAVVSLVVLSGWSGTISLGQFAIVGVGGVVAGDLIVKTNVDLFLALIAAAAAGAVTALVVGLPALRVKGLFLAVTSLAFAAAMDQYFLNPTNYPNWIPSDISRPVLWKRLPLHSERAMYYLCLGALVLVILVVRAFRSARPGRVLLASRDNPRAAAAMAVPVTRTRLEGMIFAGIVAGVAGALYATLQAGIRNSSFPTETSVLLFAMAVVGGLGSISGALCGVALTELLVSLLGVISARASSLAPFATGALLLGVLLVVPGGVGQGIEWVRDRIVRKLAGRRGISFDVGAAAGSIALADQTESEPGFRAVPTAGDRGEPILACHNLTASYGSLQVLFGVDLEVAEGEVVALLGTNGAGKSTVFKAITGLLPPTGGSVRLAGKSIRGHRADEVACSGLGMMPGGRGVFPTLTVAENLHLACWQIRSDRPAAAAAREEMLDLFPILRERRGQMAGNLSGGEQQQLSLAMAFVTKPRVLFIDELSLGLAPTIVSQLCDKVRDIHDAGTTIVVVEQSVNVALVLAKRAIFLEKGKVRFEGPTAGLLERPDILRSVFIGGGKDGGTHPEIAGRVKGDRPNRGVGLSCHGIVKRFGGITAIAGADLDVAPGRIVGLIGHNGAGKTTLFDVISGFLIPDGGRVLLAGQDITGQPAYKRAVAGLGRSFQEALLYPSLTVLETILVALERHLPCRDPMAAALGLPASLHSEAAAFRRARELIELLGLAGFADTPNADLSTGTRRIVELACVLAMDPAVVLLDEPSAGVAQKETEALGPLLRQVQAETGCSIVIIEHDMALLSSLCDELVALDQGAVICTGPPAEVLAHRRVIESYLGTDEAAIQRSGAAV